MTPNKLKIITSVQRNIIKVTVLKIKVRLLFGGGGTVEVMKMSENLTTVTMMYGGNGNLTV